MTGEVDQAAYQQFLAALASGSFSDFENLPRAPGGTAAMANPLGGLVFNMEGPDSPATSIPASFTPPPIASRKKAAEAKATYPEPNASFHLTKFDGMTITI